MRADLAGIIRPLMAMALDSACSEARFFMKQKIYLRFTFFICENLRDNLRRSARNALLLYFFSVNLPA
jgi:hypothetical protein